MACDGVLWRGQRNRPRQVHQGAESQGGLDRIHLQVRVLYRYSGGACSVADLDPN